MTEAQKAAIEAMMHNSRAAWEECEAHAMMIDEMNAIQAYASCSMALSLDRIAHAISEGIDPEVPTALSRIAAGIERIAQATEGLESVLPRQ